MTRSFYRWTDWIVDWPWLTIALLVLITLVSCVGHFAPDRARDLFRPAAVAEPPNTSREEVFERPPDVNPFDIGNADAVVVSESSAFFSPNGARAIRRVVERIESLPYVREVVWMDRVPVLNIFGLPEPMLPRETATQTRFDQARSKALANPLVNGQFLSADGNTLLLMVYFDFFFVETNESCIEGLREIAEEAVADLGTFDAKFYVTGRIPMFLAAMDQHEANVYKYQAIGYGMILLMSLILFRGVAAVIIVAVAPALGVFWTVGLLPYFDMQNNPFNDVILPVLVSLVGLTDGVHLMVHIRKLRAAGASTQVAARQGVREVGLACGLTSLTTAIGFGSLALASHEVVREFGWCCVIGVVMTFLSVIISIPLLCASWLGRSVHRGLEKSLIDRNLGRIGGLIEYVLQRPRRVSYTGITLTLVLAALSLTLRPDERRAEALPEKSEPVVGLRKMDAALGGLEMGEVSVRWSNRVAANSAEILQAVGEVDRALQQEPLIGHPISIHGLVAALPGDGEAGNRMSMLELLPPPLKRAFYTPEFREAKVKFRVQDLGIAKYGPIFERIKTRLVTITQSHPEFTLNLQGGAVWRWENLYKIVIDLVKSLASASLIIFVVLALVYRSIRIGLISVIPNVFPLVLAATFLVVTGQYLEMVSVCAFTVCLGIAVDDTIHFLTRYYEERRRCDDEHEAIRRAFTGVGTALIMTTVVLLAGFMTVLSSESREHRIFAWMGGITIASALFGDLVFLPALLAQFGPKRAIISPSRRQT